MAYQKANPSKAVKLVIQGGLVPKEVLQQLIRWGLLPENSSELSGSQPTDYETSWDSAEEFVTELQQALSKEASTIRETELDPAGGFRKAKLEFVHGNHQTEQVFVDKLGRVVTPPGFPYKDLCFVTFEEEATRRTIVRHEQRYQGDQVSSLVHYPESLEGQDVRPEQN
jgi:hypothetical protein